MNEEKAMQIIINLKKFNNDLMDLNIKYGDEIQRLKSIIEEVREYIENNSRRAICNDLKLSRNEECVEILEILEKVDDNK